MPGSRSNSTLTATCISSRASGAPTHAWIPTPKLTCGFGDRVASNRSGSANFAGSRLADPSRSPTISPLRNGSPATSTSSSAYRVNMWSGASNRSISSTWPVALAATAAAGSGTCSRIAFTPLPRACTVASWPALSSRIPIVTISSSVRPQPAPSVAVTSCERKSSLGSRRRAATNSRTSAENSTVAATVRSSIPRSRRAW